MHLSTYCGPSSPLRASSIEQPKKPMRGYSCDGHGERAIGEVGNQKKQLQQGGSPSTDKTARRRNRGCSWSHSSYINTHSRSATLMACHLSFLLQSPGSLKHTHTGRQWTQVLSSSHMLGQQPKPFPLWGQRGYSLLLGLSQGLF